MRIALHKSPTCTYAKEAFLALMEEGYALPIDTHEKATVLLFKDVDDHIDGNGMAVLWMLEGEGTFFHDGAPIALKKGDAVIFDDNIEHGFEANDYCLAVNFDIGPQQDLGASNIMAMFDAFEKQHRTKMDLAVISGPTPTF